MLLMGDTGSGKSNAIRQILRQVEERGETAVVYDPAGEFTAEFFRPERGDLLLNPLDARCPVWQIGSAITGPAAADAIATAAADGLQYRLAGTLVGDTTDAQRLLKLAVPFGLQPQLLERLYKGYFSEHQNMFDRETLTRLAVDCGLQRTVVEAMFAGDEFRDAVESDKREAQQRHLSGVPFFLFGEKLSIHGAQAQEVFSATLERAWDTESLVTMQVLQGAVCGPEGCNIP